MMFPDLLQPFKVAVAIMASFLPSSLASLNYEPLSLAIEQLARQLVAAEIQSQLLEREQNRPTPHAVPSNADTNVTDTNVYNEIGRIIDEKWEDKAKALKLEMEQKEKKEAEQREKDWIKNVHSQLNQRISGLEKIEAQAETPADNQSPRFGSFGKRRRMPEEAQKEAAPSKEQYESLSRQVDSVKLDQDAMKKATEASTQALQEMQGRLQNFENSIPSNQAIVTISDAAATPTACVEGPTANVIRCNCEDLEALVTKTDGYEKRIASIENVFTQMPAEDMWNFYVYATHKFNEYDDKFNKYDGYFSTISTKFQEIAATQEQQAKLLNETVSKQTQSSEQQQTQQQTQQQGASDKDISDLKQYAREQAASKDKEIADLKAANEKLAEDNAENVKQIESLKADAAKCDAEQKVQNDRIGKLEQLVGNLVAAHAGTQNAGQQSPVPNQQQPPLFPPQPSPAPQGNGPWTPVTTPPNPASDPVPELDVPMGEVDEFDSEMMDAPPQPPHVPQQSQVPQPPHQPSRQPLFQSPQPSTATPRDTPMANAAPVIPNSNGNVGAAQKPQPIGGTQSFPSNGPTKPSPTTPSGSAPGTSRQHFGPLPQQPVGSGNVPSKPASSTPARATPAAPASEKGNLFAKSIFNFNTAPPVVNTPQINWGSQMGKMNFDPPADLADDDDKPLAGKGKMSQANAAPATPSTGLPAAKMASPQNTSVSSAANVTGVSGSNAPATPMANNAGPSSSTTGSPSTPAKPTPKPQKKKPSVFIQRRPAATPSKPAEVTSKAQTAQTPAASTAAMKQSAFRNLYNTPSAPQTASPAPVSPMAPMQPAGGESQFLIPGLTGAPNNSPFALKPKTPASKTTTSPYMSQSRTHDTVESSSPVNVFLKEVVVVPEVKPGAAEAGATEPAKPDDPDDIYMSDSDSKPAASEAPEATNPEATDNDAAMSDPQGEPETTEASTAAAPEPEAKPLSPLHEPDLNPRKHIHAEKAPVVQSANDAMDTDRPVIKAKGIKGKGLLDKMTPAQRTEHAWVAYEMALNAPPPEPKKPARPEEDEVDYADPNDLNDEDVHTTTMDAPKKSIKLEPTKYSLNYFLGWRKVFMASVRSSMDKSYAENLCKDVVKLEHGLPLPKMVEQAGFPRAKRGYERHQIMCVMSFWFEETFLEAVRVVAGGPVEDEHLDPFRQMFKQTLDAWFARYKPDTI